MSEEIGIFHIAGALSRLLVQLGFEPFQCDAHGDLDKPACLSQPAVFHRPEAADVVLDKWGRRHETCPGPMPDDRLQDTEENRLRFRQRVVSILKHFGADEGVCRSCEATVYWIVTRAGKRAPYQSDARSHFAACPAAESFRRQGR